MKGAFFVIIFNFSSKKSFLYTNILIFAELYN